MSNLCGHFKDGVSKACSDVSGKKRGRIIKGNTWWWNENVKKAISRKKHEHKTLCWNSTEKNGRRCKVMRNKAKKAILYAIRGRLKGHLKEV